MTIIVIGAGIAGLTAARKLADAGLGVVVLDKGRGIGGRVATRRAMGLHFDHGAQYVSAKGAGFAAVLGELAASGHVGAWQTGHVGTPGMSALAKGIGAGLSVRQEALVTGLSREDKGWRVHLGDEVLPASQVICTVPTPQVAGIIGADHPLVARLTDVAYAPNLTLMAAIDGPAPFITKRDPDADLAWIAQDSTKPDRPQGPVAWVAQASTAFSETHLELEKDAIADLMLPLLLDRLGATLAQVRYAAAHRWRYGQVTQALGAPFLRDDTGTLYLGGDWCLGPKVEDAWTSGTAIADDLLARDAG
ncbi:MULTISPECIES: NAD(P)/FAD-dependent oxidoreductase [unclassified Yoonia]|uniref:NAD(P)/FAD-dependent oxidoreductase n=1 Tax=unclassified Yoonia TaxID=2629118 RepID=UPI002AFDE2DE|nr:MULTISPECIES: FAD-dependent oxidoreductase [unclassified Yoonia]